MTSSVRQRLESWRNLLQNGGPDWLIDHAPRIIAQLEAEAIATEAQRAETRSGSVHEGAAIAQNTPGSNSLKGM